MNLPAMVQIYCTYFRACHLTPLQLTQCNGRHELPKCTSQGCWQLIEQGKAQHQLTRNTNVQEYTHWCIHSSLAHFQLHWQSNRAQNIGKTLYSLAGSMQFPLGFGRTHPQNLHALVIRHRVCLITYILRCIGMD